MTTWPPLLSTAAISRSGPTAAASASAKARSTLPPLNSAEPTIAWVAPPAMTLDARSTVRMPPPTRQGSAAQIRVDQLVVVPLVLRRVEIDQLHLGPAAEAVDPFVDGVALERQPFALNELDDAAAHEIDRGDQHLFSSCS